MAPGLRSDGKKWIVDYRLARAESATFSAIFAVAILPAIAIRPGAATTAPAG